MDMFNTKKFHIFLMKKNIWAILAIAAVGTILLVPSGLAFAVPNDNSKAKPNSLECDGEEATHLGTKKAEEVVGDSDSNVIIGLQGNDLLRAGQSEDKVCGNNGDDVIYGGADGDRLFGGNGDDIIYERNLGGVSEADDKDYIDGGNGYDTCYVDEDKDEWVNCEVVVYS